MKRTERLEIMLSRIIGEEWYQKAESRIVQYEEPTGELFEILFPIETMQKIQDDFCKATGLASAMTTTRGKLLTEFSNFCSLCDCIRNTPQGSENCRRSDELIGRYNADGPTITECYSAGLSEAGVPITAGPIHIGSWLIGQVINDEVDIKRIEDYCNAMGMKKELIQELMQTPIKMSLQQFEAHANHLYSFANLLSDNAYQQILAKIKLRAQEETQKNLEKSKSEYFRIISSVSEGIFRCDSEMRITFVNQAMENIYGLTTDALIGKCISEIGSSQNNGQNNSQLKNYLETLERRGFAGFLKYTITRKDKEKRILELSMSRNNQDEKRNYSGVIRDITEQEHLEQSLIRTERLDALKLLVTHFSHEVLNPITSLTSGPRLMYNRLLKKSKGNQKAAGNNDLSLEQLEGYLKDRGVDTLLTQAINQGERAVEMVKSLLHFARPGDDEEKIYVDPIKLLDETIDMIIPYSSLKSLKIKKDYTKTPDINCQPTKIKEVYINILQNSIDALRHQEDPQIIVRSKTIDDYVSIEIEDNGEGMSEEIQRRIFEPFYTTKEVDKGTGMGLATSYTIITEEHRGKIEVESSSGLGTRFTLLLPIE
jgi:PAS domain S-box-containing protein